MTSFREVLERGPIKVGLFFLFLAILLSGVAMFHTIIKFSRSGEVTFNGTPLVGGDVVYNTTLSLTGNGSVVLIYPNGTVRDILVEGNNDIKLGSKRAMVQLLNGTVSYRYTGVKYTYPYSSLSLVAFVLMLVGIVLVFSGLTQFYREVGGRTREKTQSGKGRGEDN